MPMVRTDDGVAIAYEARGAGPRTLLFLHGWAGSGAFWDETLQYLDLTGLRAITFDYRGHGASEKATTGYTLDRFAADAFAVAGAAGAEEVVVVGYSMSGKFGQYLACARPDRVAGQVLVAGCTAGEFPFPPEVQREWVSLAGDRERLRVFERQFITQPVRPEVLDRWLDDAVKVPAAALDETLSMCARTSFSEQVAGSRLPTLVIGGAHDGFFSPEVLRQSVLAPLVGARLVVLDANHDLPIEQPREFAGLLEAFVAGLG